MKLAVLGSGTSFGVPQIGCSCPVCTSGDPRDRRSRVAAVVEDDSGDRRILIDTPPELRLQLVSCGITSIDAVLYTHEHADHVHGIDDLRAVSVKRGALEAYGSAATLDRIRERFTYIFDDGVPAPPGSSKPELHQVRLEPGVPVEIAGMDVLPLEVEHGPSRVLGYRIGALGYVTDVKRLGGAVIERLRGVRVLVLGALFEHPHPTHLSIPEAIDAARAVGAGRTVLTHLTHRYSHAQLEGRLPSGVEPAYDGMEIAV